jgi:hypothetical protein
MSMLNQFFKFQFEFQIVNDKWSIIFFIFCAALQIYFGSSPTIWLGKWTIVAIFTRHCSTEDINISSVFRPTWKIIGNSNIYFISGGWDWDGRGEDSLLSSSHSVLYVCMSSGGLLKRIPKCVLASSCTHSSSHLHGAQSHFPPTCDFWLKLLSNSQRRNVYMSYSLHIIKRTTRSCHCQSQRI